ncbi:MAG: ABC transporter substrate-binding protein [Verrucomicrobiota bacterium]
MVRLISSILIAAIVLVGCDSTPPPVERGQYPLPKDVLITEAPAGEYGGLFIQTETTQPTTFNYLVPNNLTTSIILSRMFDGLISYDPIKAEIVSALAKDWEIADDEKTYTFYLREGIKWSDGEDLTADDVLFTFDTILSDKEDPETGRVNPLYPSRYYSKFKFEDGKLEVKKIDDYTVQFYTPSVYAPFLFDLMNINILPEHKLGEAHSKELFFKSWTTQTGINEPSEIVGTGAFVMEVFRPGERLILKPNPHYWKADQDGKRLPYIDRLIFKFVTAANTEIVSFATGQTSISGIGPTDVAWVRRNEALYDFTIHEREPSTSISMIWLNQNPGKDEDGNPYVEPYKLDWFQNKLFRQALFYAFDREAVIEATFFGQAVPIDSMISQAQKGWHNPDVRKFRYNPDKSRELLKEAGFTWNESGQALGPEGNPVEFTILMPAGSSAWEDLIVTFKENLNSLGITLNINPIDFATLIRKMDYTFDYEAGVIGWGSASAAYDPSGSKAMYLSEGVYHLWHPKQKEPATEWEARIDELFREQEQILDIDKRREIMNEVQAILAEQVPFMLLVAPKGYVGIKNRWRNYEIPPAGITTWNLEEFWTPDPQADNQQLDR